MNRCCAREKRPRHKSAPAEGDKIEIALMSLRQCHLHRGRLAMVPFSVRRSRTRHTVTSKTKINEKKRQTSHEQSDILVQLLPGERAPILPAPLIWRSIRVYRYTRQNDFAKLKNGTNHKLARALQGCHGVCQTQGAQRL